MLTVVSLILLFATDAKVNGLIPFYAIGVFTGFSMAGFGMAKYHKRVKESGWRRRLVINRHRRGSTPRSWWRSSRS